MYRVPYDQTDSGNKARFFLQYFSLVSWSLISSECACEWIDGLGRGAGRARSRNNSRNKLDYQDVLDNLKTKGISIRVASPKLVMEEAPESYKDVTEVVNTCHDAGISKKAVKLRPIAVVKG